MSAGWASPEGRADVVAIKFQGGTAMQQSIESRIATAQQIIARKGFDLRNIG